MHCLETASQFQKKKNALNVNKKEVDISININHVWLVHKLQECNINTLRHSPLPQRCPKTCFPQQKRQGIEVPAQKNEQTWIIAFTNNKPNLLRTNHDTNDAEGSLCLPGIELVV